MSQRAQDSINREPQINTNIANRTGGKGCILECPKCGDAFMHQRSVEVYNQSEADDQSVGFEIDRGNNSISIGGDPEDNPSGRRGGIRIEFECETCSASNPHHLVVEQSKGNEYIYWES